MKQNGFEPENGRASETGGDLTYGREPEEGRGRGHSDPREKTHDEIRAR